MTRRLVLALLVLLLLAACQPNYQIVTVTPTEEAAAVSVLPTEAPPTLIPPTAPPPTELPPTEAPPAAEPVAAGPLPAERAEFFSTSGVCAVCHANMTDEAGQNVSLDSQWRSSMMASAAIDPYWQAGVRNEVLMNPDYADFIQDKCTTCHMPMARFTAAMHDGQGVLLGEEGFTNPDHPLHTLAMDGISCALCHQFEGDNLGTAESFSGHYDINPDLPSGERHAYGPFPVTETNQIVMQAASGFIPQEAAYTRDSAMCGVCHTLYTPTLNDAGEIVGEFAEQMVYPEWEFSAYRDEQSCQDCHMPAAEGGVVLSVTGGEPRSPFMQHIYAGGNFYMPDLLRRYREELGFTAGDEQVEATLAQVMDQLQNRTATLAMTAPVIEDGVLHTAITVASMVGHKFPTSYPARRTWLHVTVRDANGAIVFESGAFNPDGSITGNDSDADPALYEPHYDVITRPDEVQIYEAIMGDVNDQPTTTLLRGAGYLKDNRLLPEGFDKAAAPPDFQVWGAALDDPDFVGGSDVVRFAVPVGDAEGPFTVEAELLYQSIAYRWAHNLARHDGPETNRFVRYYTEYPSPAAVVASASAGMPE
ncbi:MAG: hypothetical protein Kow0077_28700 [Anaerolineae bacterium]